MTQSPSEDNPIEMTFKDWRKTHTVKVVEAHSLVCTEAGSSKFWKAYRGVDCGGRTKPLAVVVLEWGKLKAPMDGRREIKEFGNNATAIQYLRGRLRDKQVKGYVTADEARNSAVDIPVIPDTPVVLDSSYDWDLY